MVGDCFDTSGNRVLYDRPEGAIHGEWCGMNSAHSVVVCSLDRAGNMTCGYGTNRQGSQKAEGPGGGSDLVSQAVNIPLHAIPLGLACRQEIPDMALFPVSNGPDA